MKNIIKLCLITLLLASTSCSDDPVKENHKTTVDVINPILGTVTGTATLERTVNKIKVDYETTNLISDHCYTLWWVVWNNPKNCDTPGACGQSDFAIADQVEVELMYATGLVADGSGLTKFSAELEVGNDSGSENALFGFPSAGGLQTGKTFSAQVVVAVRSHGPAIPGKIQEQIGSYIGGCTDPLAIAPFTEIPDQTGECGDIELAVFAPVN